MRLIIYTLLFFIATIANGQRTYWQQHVDYKMDIDFDVNNHKFNGVQVLKYTNNSPDTLHRVFYHLYYNAFQPGSMMDVRSRSLPDPDRRVMSRIVALRPNEIGYQKIDKLTQDGTPLEHEVEGTILEVKLAYPIVPGASTTFEMEFNAQVPIQIRRTGRDNAEGVSYSMTQWYPKLSEYDYEGWHPNPYIAREFHGVWGDFEVNINIDADYLIGASGVLQNGIEIGHGYQPSDIMHKGKNGNHVWNFKAENVIDFAWVADPEYKHITKRTEDGTLLHFIFQPGEETSESWAKLPQIMEESLKFINENFGQYQFPGYTFAQGGDGGMEYPMITLINGRQTLGGLASVSIHEFLHSWYQFTLATNESLYPWMDEGFTEYAEDEVKNHLRKVGLLPGEVVENPHIAAISRYIMFTQSGLEEPSSTHSDHFSTNRAYTMASYIKGNVILNQLQYIMGDAVFKKAFKKYYDTWKFKHPTPNDFIRVMEKESGLVLDWVPEYFIETTKTIDYGINSVVANTNGGTKVSLERIGLMPMPIDIEITMKDGSKQLHHIPLRIMRGEKSFPMKQKVVVEEDWPWTNTSYEFQVPMKFADIESLQIDPSRHLADVVKDNNTYIIADK